MGTSIFTLMSKLAIEHNAINLGQGFPDFDGPSWIFDEAFKVMTEGKNQYAPMPGILTFRKKLAQNYKHYYDIDIDHDNGVCVTAGATEALFSSISAFINPGDEVILFEPAYDAYPADILLSGGIPKYVTLRKPDFGFDFNDLDNALTSKTKAIIINNPHNPTGKVYTRGELEEISKFAIKNNLIVISDEVYEFLTYDDAIHIPIASLPGMYDRTITISSTGKTFSLTGWKIGYAVGKPELIEAIKKIHQWTTFAVNTPGQHAMAFAFTKLDEYLPDFKKMYLGKRNLMLKRLEDSSFVAHKPLGSYFIMVDIPKDIKDDDLAMRLVKDYQVATVPTQGFYGKSREGETMLRLCFAKTDETIMQGIENLKKYV
jgi:N-succinyldiaminopimelate aminotransferase